MIICLKKVALFTPFTILYEGTIEEAIVLATEFGLHVTEVPEKEGRANDTPTNGPAVYNSSSIRGAIETAYQRASLLHPFNFWPHF